MTFYFNGITRLDLGMGNPNWAGALISMLMVVAWIPAYQRRQNMWISLGLFTLMGFCLIHTFSRGAAISMIVSTAALFTFSERLRKAIGVRNILFVIAVLFLYSVSISASQRYLESGTDASVLNRIPIWEAAPRMLMDAPSGWGIGNSQEAYMQWYQPVSRTEEFRNLVSFHLTLLTEISWPLRITYITLCFASLIVLFPRGSSQWLLFPFGVLISFFISGLFTHFEKAWIVYLFPLIIFFMVSLRIFFLRKQFLRIFSVAITLAIGLTVLIAVFANGKLSPIDVKHMNQLVVAGKGPIRTCILIDTSILGRRYGKSFRKWAAGTENHHSIGFLTNVSALPKNKVVVACGMKENAFFEALERANPSQIILLNPMFPPSSLRKELPNVPALAVFGDFTTSQVMDIWKGSEKTFLVEGSGDFLQDWPEIVFSLLKED